MKNSTRYIENYGTALPIAVICCAVVLNAIYLLAVGTMMSQRKDRTVSVETRMRTITPDYGSQGYDTEQQTLAARN